MLREFLEYLLREAEQCSDRELSLQDLSLPLKQSEEVLVRPLTKAERQIAALLVRQVEVLTVLEIEHGAAHNSGQVITEACTTFTNHHDRLERKDSFLQEMLWYFVEESFRDRNLPTPPLLLCRGGLLVLDTQSWVGVSAGSTQESFLRMPERPKRTNTIY